jgi:hypothetical protein
VKLLRAVLAHLDPWAALVLGVLVALGVVILLATPGPWHKVVGPAPAVELAPPSPTDVAIFALTGRHRACEAVIWAHVDHEVPTVTTVVVAPSSQGFLAGAGFMPLARMVDVAGPAAATTALGQAVGAHMDAWLTLDDEALRMALSAAEPALPGKARVTQYQGGPAAWDGSAAPDRAWDLQTAVLVRNVPRVPWGRTSIIGFANYVLGFGHIHTDMDLQQATSLATTFKHLPPSQARACALAVLFETCRKGEAVRVDPEAAARLRRELAAGWLPPPSRPQVTLAPRAARVLVVLPGKRPAARVYVDEVRRRLRASAGAPVTVKAITVTAWPRLAGRTLAAARAFEPLAVLVAPPVVSGDAEAADAATSLRVLGTALRLNWLPAVLSEPLPDETTFTATPVGEEVRAAVASARQPVSPLSAPAGVTVPAPASPAASASPSASPSSPAADGSALGDAAAAVRAARANVATLVRSCWPGTLAPRLTSTRLGFSFAARRRTLVSVVAASPEQASGFVDRLRTWGFQAQAATDEGPLQLSGEAVLYRAGLRRAALSLAGDLGLSRAAVTLDASASAPLTLVVR